jgi:hypothetical protein
MTADIVGMSSHSEIVEQNEWFAACLELRRCFVARESPSPELAARVVRAEQAKRDRQAADPDCAHNVLARAFGLSVTQLELVWLSVALATDAEVQSRAAELGLATNEIEIEAARQIIYGSGLRADALDELCESATPFRLGLLERTDAGKSNTPFGKQTWACSRRLLTWLFGGRGCAPELARFASCPSDAKALSELHLPAASIGSARSAVVRRRAIVVASGSPSLGRRTLLRAAASDANIAILEVDAKQLAKEHEQLARQLKLIARECKLLERVPLVRDIDKLVDDHDQTRVDMVGRELVAELDGLVLVTCGTQRPAMRWDRSCVVVEVKPPTSLQRGAFWLECLGQGTEDDAQFLAGNYPLAPALIHAAARAATSRANGRSIQPDDIFAGIRAVLDDRLGDFATRIEVSQSWDDLVLPTDQIEVINYLLARIRQRRTVYETWGYAAKVGKGLGTSALFSGPPGTGKTMVAALIARELGLDLYQVDVSKVVSKWIGETERNLATLFDAADAGGAILLFDEADSLFGKRTELKSSTIATQTSRRTTSCNASRASPASVS